LLAGVVGASYRTASGGSIVKFHSLQRVIAIFLFCVLPLDAHALRITEFLASNVAVVADEDGQFSDWLEVYNETGGTVSLAGWHLTDDAAALTKWQFPAVALPAGGYLLVWASDKNRAVAGLPLHTNFKLSAGGEYLALVRPDGTTVEHAYAPQFPAQLADVSYGLDGALSVERCFTNPTPGAANDESTSCGVVEAVSFSSERGFYFATFNLALATSTPGATIRYTTDGSSPSASTGTIYSAPIPITTTTPVRAIATKTGLIATPVATHTYFFLEDVLQQSVATLPPGYPDKWSGGVSSDYDMDPEVVNHPEYAPEILSDLQSIPTMSIVTSKDDLFGATTGIYTHPSRRGDDYERAVSMELIFGNASADNTQVGGGLRIQGDYSRSANNKKHSFRLSFKDQFGPDIWEYPFFPDSEVDRIDQLVLTGGHGNAWHNGFSTADYIRDTWCKDTQLDMGDLAPHSRYVHLYLNGIYWGMYRVTERPNSGFLAAHLGGTKDDYDVIKAHELVDGDKIAWDTMQVLADAGLASPAAYQALLQYLDVDHLIDYFLVNLYANNTDWDSKNWYAGRRREPGAGYMFFSWDGEQTMLSPNGSRATINNFDAPSSVFTNLRKESPEFQRRMGDRVHKHLFNDGALTPARAKQRWLERGEEIQGALVAESARWGDKGREQPFTRNVEWVAEKHRLLLTYFSRRAKLFVEQLRDLGLYPEVEAPVFSQHGGDFDPALSLAMSANDGTVYYTTDGSDPRAADGSVAPTSQSYVAPANLTQRTTVRARTLLGSDWSALNEADFARDVSVRVSELMFNPQAAGEIEFIELVNVGSSPVSLTSLTFTQGIAFNFAGGTLAPGARTIVAEDQAAFEAYYGTGFPIAGSYSGRLANDGERVVLTGADGSVVQDFEFNDSWYPASDGGGHSLVVRDTSAPKELWSTPDAWRSSAFADGSPGNAELALCANGLDDDGDGTVDFPGDLGCASGGQDTEDPACNDGLDDDGDGAVDTTDADCLSASDPLESPEPINSFQCYRSRQASGTSTPETVTLDDSIEGTGIYSLRSLQSVCLAADLDGVKIVDPDLHLAAYEIRAAAGAATPFGLTGVRVETVFGPVIVDTRTPDRLLVPSSMDLNAPTTAPNDAAHVLDSYKCYRLSLTRGAPAYFPANAQVHVDDLLGSHDLRLKKPYRLCVPTDLGSGVKYPERSLLCYPTRGGDYNPRHEPVFGLHTATTFGQAVHDTQREDDHCVPASADFP